MEVNLNHDRNKTDPNIPCDSSWIVLIFVIYTKHSKYKNLAVVAWSVRASGNNTGPWQVVDRIPLGTDNLSCLSLCYKCE